ncbi:sodium/potassium-transporting ATPase subunit alpha [Drosophila serrata]|uniref:sodium/potassium-transporting ATPase subunit alpha n=1 Tax=Drosophila serrata TaxID=7274 RepID=UPI000A1D24EB|nr:sodium/potassium-transporting ATPase subunit alpha [Drosophila serrata]
MDPPPLPRWLSSNVAFAGTHATKGYGIGVAIGCGKNTEIAKMMELSFKERPVSRMNHHIKQVGFYTACLALIWLIIVFFLVSNDHSYMQLEMFITIMLALSPMYLPFILFWGMTTTRNAMQDTLCYARSLEATSTVGLTTVIVTDMTRTITKRWMEVTEIFVEMELVSAETANAKELGPRFTELIQASVLCNDAVIHSGNIGVPKVKKSMYGNYQDIAMLRYGLLNLPDIKQLRQDHEKVANKGYSSADHVQVTVHRTYGANGELKLILLMKGHCDTVIRRCSTYAVRDEEIPLDDRLQDIIIKLADGLLASGRHVRAFAYKELTNRLEMRRISQTYSGGGGGEFRDYLAVDIFSLRFLGMITTYTHARTTIPKAVARCRSAGIKLVVVTSQDPNRAWAIASEIGLLLPHSDDIKSGRKLTDHYAFKPTEIVDMSEYAEEKDHHQRWNIEQMLINQRDLVCANATSEQFRWIVEECQRLGAVVSVIGGSIHDTSALTSGRVGVARLGCAALCEYSADLVLLDGSFATLTRAIAESRRLYENLKKALAYCLATNTVWIMSYLAFYAVGFPLEFDIIDIIIVAFFVNLIPALTLLYEFPEEKLMLQKPKIYDDCLLNCRLLFVSHILLGIIETAAVFTIYIMFMVDRGFKPLSLVGLNVQWHDDSVNDLSDSYGQEWSSAERRQLDCQLSSICLMAIIVMQCTSLVLNKTARAHLIEHGFDNWRLTLAALYLIVFCIALCWVDSACCLYLPGARKLDFVGFIWVIWPFVPLMIFLETTRRYFLRLFPDSWIERATMY